MTLARALRPLSRPKLLGEAKLEGAIVAFRCTGIDSRGIDTFDLRIAIELANVRTADDAIAFVGRYGPTGELPSGVLHFDDRHRAVSTLHKPIVLEEPLSDVIQAAKHLSAIMKIANDARKTRRDRIARDRLRRRAIAAFPWMAELPTVDFDRAASNAIALELNEYASQAQGHVEASGPGQFEIRLLSKSLRAACFLSVAHHLSAKVRLETCAECDRVFVVEDGRQRFCTPQCSGRLRFRRFMERKRKKGGSRASKTRTR